MRGRSSIEWVLLGRIMRSRDPWLMGAAALAITCAGCIGDNVVVALSSDGGQSTEDGGDGDGDEPGEGDASGDDGALFDLGTDAIDPDLLDPQIPRNCTMAWKHPSNMGCSFYAVDLDQAGLNDHDPWGVAVVNPQPDVDAAVKIFGRKNGIWTELQAAAIAPGEAHVFPLDDMHHAGSGVFDETAFRIDSDYPVSVVQLSPLAGGMSWRSGAGLLHPVESWTSETHLLGWRTEYEVGQPAYLSVVGAVDGTSVSVVPSMETAGGINLLPGQKGVEMIAPIDATDVLQLAAQVDEIEFEAGLTGTVVTSGGEHPVGVFSGHACAGIPDLQGNECGHMQEQINMHLQGTEFVVSRLVVRNPIDPEPVMYQLYALEDHTEVELEPGPGSVGVPLEGLTLDRGESYAMRVTGVSETAGSFLVHADKPILMAAYMENPPPSALGSASMVQLAPVDRTLADYNVYMPPLWTEQWVVIARPAGAKVAIDGELVDDAAFVPLGEYEAAQLPVEAGVHQITGDEPFSVVVNGLREGDGYAYLGGWATPAPAFPPPK